MQCAWNGHLLYNLVRTSSLITYAVVLHKKRQCLATQQRPLLKRSNVCEENQRVSFMWSRITLSLGNGWISFSLSPFQSFLCVTVCLASLNARTAKYMFIQQKISAKILCRYVQLYRFSSFQ